MRCQDRVLDEYQPKCYSPVACAAFGYCRKRNFAFGVPTNPEMIKEWQKADTEDNS